MKTALSLSNLSNQYNQRDSRLRTVRRIAERLIRTAINRAWKTETHRREINSLEDIRGPTGIWSCLPRSKLYDHTLSKRTSSALGRLNELAMILRRETFHQLLVVASRGIERASGSKLRRTQSSSLHELGSATTAPQSGWRPSAKETNLARRNILQVVGTVATLSAVGIGYRIVYPEVPDLNRSADTTPAQNTVVSHDVNHDRDTATSYEVDRNQREILTGTEYETTVYTTTSVNDGPTVAVFGGVHGNELGGIEAAQLATEYTIDCGTLFVCPEANKPAVEMERNHGPEGDLNRQFPVGDEPTAVVAHGIWDEFLRVDADFIIDMHTATALMSRGSVGQGVFPTTGAVEHAEAAVAAVNDEYLSHRVSDDLPEHAFQVGNTIPEDQPRLVDKAAADENVEGWITEVTRIDLEINEKTFLHDMLSRELLHQVGIEVISEPEMTNPF